MRVLCGVSVGSALALAVVPSAALPCPIEVRGAGSPEWQSAAAELEREIVQAEESDCSRIELELDDDVVHLTFTTTDGRSATRDLNDPRELLPTVRALNVIGPATPVKREAAPAAAPKPEPQADHASPSAPTEIRAPRDSSAWFSLLAGARGGESNLTSPIVRGAASIALDRWELGVLGGFDLHYGHVPPESAPSDTWAWVVGIAVGRREPLGDFAWLGGGRLAMAGLRQEADAEGTREHSRAEVRAGAYSALVWPRRSRTRLRADLGAEIVPHDAGTTESSYERSPVTPWWSFSLMLGVEMGGP